LRVQNWLASEYRRRLTHGRREAYRDSSLKPCQRLIGFRY
jgi:hypothetical protein